jgi:hypothetical protein
MSRTRGHGRHGRVGGRRHCYGCSAAPLNAVKLHRAPDVDDEDVEPYELQLVAENIDTYLHEEEFFTLYPELL